MKAGEVGILNVSEGDTKLSFDPKNPGEVKRAARIVKDMLRRGFALLIEVGSDEKGPLYRRAHDFDEKTTEYIIAGTPGEMEEIDGEQPSAEARPRGKAKTRRVPAASTSAIAVARTAGG